jgi:branched-chain amino acid transport system substrate-binding protein
VKRIIRFASALVAMCGVLVVGQMGSNPAGASPAPITIGLITSLSGGGAPELIGIQDGAEARIDLQNAKGGVNGHQLKLVTADDGSSASGNQLAAQELVDTKKAFAVMDESAFVFGAAPFLNKAGIPVVGGGADGPEWGEQPNTNMFDLIAPTITPFNGVDYGYNTEVAFLKDIGVTKLAVISVDVPSAITNQNEVEAEAKAIGIENCYDNDSLSLSDVNFTAVALQIKAAGCNGVIDAGITTQTVALSETLQETGVHAKEFYYGIPESLLAQPGVHQALIGTYSTPASFTPSTANAAQKAMLATLKKYTPQFSLASDSSALGSYEAADLVITGLELAGKNPTRPAFITNLRKVGHYTAGGIIAAPGLTFQHFGTVGMLPKTSCSQFITVSKKGIVPYDNNKMICGTRVALKA